MKKRILSIVLSLCIIMTLFMSVPVFAAAGISLNKTQFTGGEPGEATVSGLSDEEIEHGAYLRLLPRGETHMMNGFGACRRLPASNICEFNAQPNWATEIWLKDGDGNLMTGSSLLGRCSKAKPET